MIIHDHFCVQCESLQPGTSYRVRVAAESAGGISDHSQTCFITTEPVCPDAPGPPTLLDKPKVAEKIAKNCPLIKWIRLGFNARI
jgi:hypothetical protein